MTVQKDQIQALVNEIDGVLQRTTSRLPWVMSGETAQQRQMLERVRNFLVTMQRRSPTAEPPPNLLAYDVAYKTETETPPGPTRTAELDTNQLLQAVLQEMAHLRTNLMQPLQTELAELRQQRELMVQELQQLEQRRQAQALPAADSRQLSAEIVQVLLERLQETLPHQVAQSVQKALPASGAIAPVNANQQAQIQAIQDQSDELLINLDTTIRVIFESLKRDLQAYQESMSEGLERMHTLGHQGEMMFSALIGHLAENLGRGASSYLKTSEATGQKAPDRAPTPPSLTAPDAAFPYAGAEVPPPDSPPEPAAADPLDRQIDNWLDAMSIPESVEDPEAAALTDAAGLDLTDLDLGDLELGRSPLDDTAADVADAFTDTDTDFSPEDTTDIDAALKLLEQLREQESDTSPVLAEAEAQLAQMMDGTDTPATVPETASAPTGPAEDEFYDSLFGPDAITPPSPLDEPEAAIAATPPTTDPTLGWDLLPGEEDSADTAPPLSEADFEPLTDTSERGTDEIGALTDLLGAEVTTSPELGGPEATAETELVIIDQPPAGAEAEPDADFDMGFDLAADADADLNLVPEDQYIPAPPDETLLPPDEPVVDPTQPELWLDDSARDQLDQELLNLEDATGNATGLPFDVGGAESELPDYVRDLLEEDAPPSVTEPPAATDTTAAAAVRLEGMDDLFSDAADAVETEPAPPDVPATADTVDFLFDEGAAIAPDSRPETAAAPEPAAPAPEVDNTLDFLFDEEAAIAQEPATTPEPAAPEADNTLDFLFDEEEAIAQETTATPAAPPAPTADNTLDFLFDEEDAIAQETPDTAIAETVAEQFDADAATSTELDVPTTAPDITTDATSLGDLENLFEALPDTSSTASEAAAPTPQPAADDTIDNLFEPDDMASEAPPSSPAPNSDETLLGWLDDESAVSPEPAASTTPTTPEPPPAAAVSPASGESRLSDLEIANLLDTTDEPADAASVPEAVAPDAPFTLEGMDDLFADVPPATAESVPPPISPPATETTDDDLTLGDVDSLFGDLPDAEATPVPPPAASAPTDNTDFGLLEPTPTEPSSPSTDAKLADLFGDLPPIPGNAPDTASPESADAPPSFADNPFADLFGDVPDTEAGDTEGPEKKN